MARHHATGHPRGAGRHRRGDHQRRHRAGRDVLGPGDHPDPVPGPDRVHRRVRRAAGHPRGALPAGAGAGLRHRRAGSGGPACSPGRRAGTSAPAAPRTRVAGMVNGRSRRVRLRRAGHPRAADPGRGPAAGRRRHREPRAGRAGPCGVPGRRDRARPRRVAARSTASTSSCSRPRAGCTPTRRGRWSMPGCPWWSTSRWPRTPVDALAVLDAARHAGVPLTVFQNRRYDAEHVTMRERGPLGSARRGVPGRDPLGTMAAHAQGAVAGDRAGRRGRRDHARPAAPTSWTPRSTCSARWRASTPRSSAAPPCPRTTRSWRAGTSPGRSATSAPAPWPRRPGPAIRVLGRAAAFVLNAFERDLDIYPDLRTDDGHCGWIYDGASGAGPAQRLQPGRLLPSGRCGAAGGRRAGGHAGRPPRRRAHPGGHRRRPGERRERQRGAGDHPR